MTRAARSAKITSAGAYIWGENFGAQYAASSLGLAVDRNGDVVVTGNYMGTLDFGSGFSFSAPDNDTFFVAKFSGTNGGVAWANSAE